MIIRKNKFRASLLAVSLLTNFWLWKILLENIFLAILLCVLSFLLFFGNSFKDKKKFYLIILPVALLIFTIVFNVSVDRQLFKPSDIEIAQRNFRDTYYGRELNRLYLNKVSLFYFKNLSYPLQKLQKNIFTNLDINLYFFASHPLERGGVDEFQKFPAIFLIPFLIGIFNSLFNFKKNIVMNIYFICAIVGASLTRETYDLGPVFMFPVVAVFSAVGLELLSKLRR